MVAVFASSARSFLATRKGKRKRWHYQGIETRYAFSSVEQLMADFWSDVRTLRDGK